MRSPEGLLRNSQGEFLRLKPDIAKKRLAFSQPFFAYVAGIFFKIANFAVMKKFYGILLLAVALAASTCLKKVEHNPSENKETAFGYIMQSYAKGTGTAGFKTLADNAVIFANNCYLTAFNPEEISENDVKTLCSNWKTCRES